MDVSPCPQFTQAWAPKPVCAHGGKHRSLVHEALREVWVLRLRGDAHLPGFPRCADYGCPLNSHLALLGRRVLKLSVVLLTLASTVGVTLGSV